MKENKLQIASARARADALLQQMTLEEKLGQIPQKPFGWECYRKTATGYRLTDTFKNEVARRKGLGCLYGLFRADPWSGANEQTGIPFEDRITVYNMVQQYVVEHSPHGIPVLISGEATHGAQSIGSPVYPVNLAVGCSFNPALYRACCRAVSQELRSTGMQLMLSSAVDMLCDPRWGRSEECYGEDPHVAYVFARALAEGVQGDDLTQHCAAVLKHVCAQGACEGGRNLASAKIGPRELREVHLSPVRGGVDGGALGFMAAYNDVDGVPCHANAALFSGMRADGFEGFVMADGFGIDRLTLLTDDPVEAGALALRSGIDVGLWDDASSRLYEALEQGRITEADVDRAVLRILTVKFALGLFDKPYLDGPYVLPASTLPRQMAEETPVLVKNDGILPLRKDINVLAVGALADSVYGLLGDYTSYQPAGTVKTYREAFAAKFGKVRYVRGCGIKGPADDWDAAIEAAAQADVVVFVAGGSSERDFGTQFAANGAAIVSADTAADCGEGYDLSEVELYECQTRFAAALAAANKNLICIVSGGRPYGTEKLLSHCRAGLYSFYNGQCAAEVMADILTGDVNPSGKFSVSVPKCSAQLPVTYYKRENGVQVDDAPQFPFGYGLSYTKFAYTDLQIEGGSTVRRGGSATVSVTVSNVGDVAGKETVLLYVKACRGDGVLPRTKLLKAFAKVDLPAHESKRVVLRMNADAFSQCGVDGTFGIAAGRYVIEIENCVGEIVIE